MPTAAGEAARDRRLGSSQGRGGQDHHLGLPGGPGRRGGRAVTLIDADPQASAAEWVEEATDDVLGKVDVIEAPTERLLNKALGHLGPGTVAVVDTPPAHEQLLAKALERADVVIVPTRVGGVETPGPRRCST